LGSGNVNDSVAGDSGDDLIDGAGGDDDINGGAGNDLIFGRSGNDTLSGGAGNDQLDGGTGNDSLLGGEGDDFIIGGLGADTVVGGSGYNSLAYDREPRTQGVVVTFTSASGGTVVDEGISLDQFDGIQQINGSRFRDVMTGTGGDQVLNGLDGDDTVSGGDGNDLLYGGSGNDMLFGGAGDDIIDDGLGYDTINGGAGVDTFKRFYDGVDYGTVLALDLNRGLTYSPTSPGDGSDFLIEIENLEVSGGYTFLLMGNSQQNVLKSANGDDTLYGMGGSDSLLAGEGDDLLSGGLGDDYLDGGAGTDTVTYAGQTGSVIASLVAGTATGADGNDRFINVENLIGGNGNDTLTGNAAANTLTGGVGNDTLNGGLGNDRLIGGAGNDIYVINGGDTIVEDTAAGTDTVQSTVAYTLGLNLENLTLTGTSAINGTGNTLNNVISGNSAANTLNGGIGNDTLNGGLGNDRLIGGVGNDVYVINGGDTIVEDVAAGTDTVQSTVAYALGLNLENLTLTGSGAINGTGNTLNNVITGNGAANTLNGGIGNDRITGGLGKDTLVGGVGADTFVFNTISDSTTVSTTWDIITDFTRGQDKIDLRTIDAFGPSAANDAFLWKGTAAFSSASAGEARFQKYDNAGTANDYTVVFLDNDADMAVEMAIRLNGLQNLAASDFMV
jgi:Ca2+-binding RTX toxin-like protein